MHGATSFLVLGSGRSSCAKCNVEAVSRLRRSTKQRLVEIAGGCCCVCGYDKNPAALQFHHVDPAQKEFGIGSGNTLAFDRVAKEAAKCVLVCANCHAEIEAGAEILALK
ncbi:hypothetical protein HJD18_08510 [Thermoleophilia bacterium SCSIO 60948]|nr:hypothetical protein HJD18_08510 [Thermoleophilia bacterium SCSIO 60948]